jgi:hypothetical protein
MAATASFVGYVKIGANLIQLMQTADLTTAAKALDTTALGGNGFEASIMGTAGYRTITLARTFPIRLR